MATFTLAALKPVGPHLRRLALVAGILALAVLVPERSVRTNKHVGLNPADVGNLLGANGAEAVTIDRSMRDFKLPDQIEWKDRPGSSTKTANVFGDPAKPGFYVQLLKRGPDDWSQPHSHPNERIINVLAGTFKIGTGAKFDKENTVSLGPGSIVRDMANQMHYDGTGPEGATIEIIGVGPSGRN